MISRVVWKAETVRLPFYGSCIPEDVVVYADSKYNFFPITDEYKRNNYVLDNFVLDEASSRITYTDDVGEVHSKTGIDVSKHQGKIDWEKVAADGIDFAYQSRFPGKLGREACGG